MRRPSLFASPFAGSLLAAVLGLGCSAAAADGSATKGSVGSAPAADGGTGSLAPPTGTGGTVPDLLPIPSEPMKECQAVLELTIRDFTPAHPDFESYNGLNDIGCGMVAPTLGPDTKPIFSSGIGTMKRVTTG